MEYRIQRSNSDSGQVKIIRLKTPGARKLHFLQITRAPRPIPVTRKPLDPPDVATLLPREAEDNSPSGRARRATRRLRRQFEKARRAAKRQARLRRADEYELLRCAYAAVRCWRQDGIAEEIERELRAGAQVAMSRASSLFLVLIRSALPRLDAKRASKWGAALDVAAHREVRSKRLAAFLHSSGGIEGAACARAKLRAESRGSD
jgi:hypothetical protein